MIGAAFNQNIDSDTQGGTTAGGRAGAGVVRVLRPAAAAAAAATGSLSANKQAANFFFGRADGRTDGREGGKVICPTGALSQPTYIHLTMLTYLVHTQITHGRIYGRVVKIMKEI